MSHPFAGRKSQKSPKFGPRTNSDAIFEAKPLWKERPTESYSFFCAQCRASRRLRSSPDPGKPKNFARIALCAAMFTLLAWKWFAWKGMVSFIPFWTAFELFHRSRLRATIPCPHCGFDPFLYLVDTKLARQQIEEHWKQKFAELNLPYPEKDAEKTRRVNADSP